MSTHHAPDRGLRFVGEFAVIVLGVFIAVAAESWWSEREDRGYERDLREDMIAEFEANLRILEADLAANDTARARIVSFVDLEESELLSMRSEELTEAIGGWLSLSGFDPEMGSAQALVESGNTGAIGDRQLRLLALLRVRWSPHLDGEHVTGCWSGRLVGLQHRQRLVLHLSVEEEEGVKGLTKRVAGQQSVAADGLGRRLAARLL